MPAADLSPDSGNNSPHSPRLPRENPRTNTLGAATSGLQGSGLQDSGFQGNGLPPSEMSQTIIENGKLLLGRERSGISYRSVLTTLALTPWAFSGTEDLDSLRLTEKLIQLNPALAAEFNAAASREGLWAQFLANIPFSGRTLPSENLLKEHVGMNEIIRDLRRGGLIEISESPPVATVNPGHWSQGVSYSVSMPSWDIFVSDRGKLVLASE